MALKVDRKSFVERFKNKQIDVDQLKHDKKLQQAVHNAGGDVDALARADLDQDGRIAGNKEFGRLFQEVDRIENRGLVRDQVKRAHRQGSRAGYPAQALESPASFVARSDADLPTSLGKAYDQLSFLKVNKQAHEPAAPQPAASRPSAEAPATAASAAAKKKTPLARGLPNTKGLSTARRYALYSQYIEQHGDQQAKKDLAAGKRVILGLRQDTPMTRDRPRLGSYDDRIVVLWKDKEGPHVKELAANTEPNRRWAEPANNSSKPVGRL
ncbi:MAG: hypothetical protein JXR83_06180, partial [Deltaproteobacteria bacterium]|nr:hypothetical protein [Deltaproteobacteria bacterium]